MYGEEAGARACVAGDDDGAGLDYEGLGLGTCVLWEREDWGVETECFMLYQSA